MSTIGAKIDALHGVREQKRQLEEQLKLVSERLESMELELMSQMDAEQVTKSTGNKATVSITSSTRPSVEDWNLFYAYMHKNKYYHLLERRPSVAGCRELFEQNKSIPGVVPFTQRRLHIRST